MHFKFTPILILIILGIAAAVILIPGNPAGKTDNSGLINIASSFAPVNDMVKQVGGNKINAIQILPDGVSPHTYEPVAADQEKLTGVTMAFIVGQNFDNWAVTMLDAAATGCKIQDLSQSISLRSSTDVDEPGNDPHYWLSYSNAVIMVEEIRQALVSNDPGNANYYNANAAAYTLKINNARVESLAKTSALTKKQFITFHAAFQYFAADLGLEVVATIEPFAGQEPTAQYLAEVGQTIEKYHISTLFREPQLSDAVVTALASDYGAKIATLNPEGSSQITYLEMMRYNVDTIVNTLSAN